ncbi:MAG: GerMN domain-containing protein [Candidatus Sericytochromatia bacterium]|nr:GerMN domain-containing protein [Candidatus Sericytochromatia bacterium]
MNIKKKYKNLMTIPFVLLILSCTKASEQSVVIYYSDPEAMYFIPVSIKITLKGDVENITTAKEVTTILEQLKVSNDEKSLRVCIPKGITFDNIEVLPYKKEIDLTLNSEKPKIGDNDEQLMIGSIVNTLTDLKGFTTVKINAGNLKSDMDYSEPISRDSYRNNWLSTSEEVDKKSSMSNVYWFSKDKKYLVPVTVPIIKNDVTSLLKVLKSGPQGSKKHFFENSIAPDLDIIMKAVNLNHIDIEIKSKHNLAKESYDIAKKAVLMSISELNVFDTVKFILPNSGEDLIDLKKTNPRKELNEIKVLATN